ncbi:MAG: RimK family alpha-L-glutamate ligase [Bacillota bacterium]
MTKIGIIGGKGFNWESRELARVMNRLQIEHEMYNITEIMVDLKPEDLTRKNAGLADLDAVLIRGIPGGSLEQVIIRMDILHYIEDMGIRVINSPGAIEKTVDKFYTTAILYRHKIPTPRTIVTEKYAKAMEAFENIGDVVVKPLFGSLGKGVIRLNNIDLAHRTFRALEQSNYVFYLQEYLEHGNEDYRIFVIKDRVVGAMKRVSPANSWKTNIYQGAIPQKVVVQTCLEELCLKAVKLLGLDYAGVDAVFSNGKYYIIEVNSCPGWKALQEVNSQNIAEALINYILINPGNKD